MDSLERAVEQVRASLKHRDRLHRMLLNALDRPDDDHPPWRTLKDEVEQANAVLLAHVGAMLEIWDSAGFEDGRDVPLDERDPQQPGPDEGGRFDIALSDLPDPDELGGT